MASPILIEMIYIGSCASGMNLLHILYPTGLMDAMDRH